MTWRTTDKVEKVKLFSRGRNRENERGQIVVMLAVSLTLLLLFLAFAVDVGFAYATKAKLSKAVDAACLTAMRNLAQGQVKAGALAVNSFNGERSAPSPTAYARREASWPRKWLRRPPSN